MPNMFKDDQLFVEREATRVVKEELKARSIFPYDTNYSTFASDIGYDIFDTHGSAKIMANGGQAKDIPFVGEEKDRQSQPVYDIVSGIRYAKAEREAVESARDNGKGAVFNLDAERPATARRYIAEQENRIVFLGESTFGIKGILDASFYGAGLGTKEAVAQAWNVATPGQILTQIRRAVELSSNNGVFTGVKTIVLPYSKWFQLTQPFNDGTSFTIMDWLSQSLPGMVNFEYFNALNAANTGVSDYMLCFVKDPMLVKVALVQDVQITPPVFDVLENSEQALRERIAGVIVKHPSSLYLGTGL